MDEEMLTEREAELVWVTPELAICPRQIVGVYAHSGGSIIDTITCRHSVSVPAQELIQALLPGAKPLFPSTRMTIQ